MANLSDILMLAQQRARDLNLAYEGACTPREAHDIWRNAPGAQLIDVRTRAELDWVGRIPGAVEIEWQAYPGNKLNEHFLAQLRQAVDRESLLLFVCRSGQRSNAAAKAATEAGFADCYNVLEGFEGDKDAAGRRNRVGGWRFHGLPWAQT
jgi:rhodanese-related sulfurtransferase